jgi:hypothetical protein
MMTNRCHAIYNSPKNDSISNSVLGRLNKFYLSIFDSYRR